MNLILEGGDDTIQRQIGDQPLIIGREPDVAICLDDKGISRHHCEIGRTETGLYVKDLGSTNGTYVNGDRIDQAMLKPGDRLGLGSHSYTVRVRDKGTETMIREIDREMKVGGKGYGTVLRQIVSETEQPKTPKPGRR